MKNSVRGIALTALVATLLAACGLAGCGPKREEGPPPITDIDSTHTHFAVLVDLSGTWHNPADNRQTARNKGVLEVVNRAIEDAATDHANNPAAIHYHVIGEGNLYAPAICTTRYTIRLIPGDEGMYDREELLTYLDDACAEAALHLPSQRQTPISQAIMSAEAAMQDVPGEPSPAKRIIILSDMKEEAVVPPAFERLDLSGFDIVVLFRALPEDQLNPDGLECRLQDWQKRLEGLGARVEVRSDGAISRSDLASILRRRLPERTREIRRCSSSPGG